LIRRCGNPGEKFNTAQHQWRPKVGVVRGPKRIDNIATQENIVEPVREGDNLRFNNTQSIQQWCGAQAMTIVAHSDGGGCTGAVA
jgi:hypothetical protein